MRPDHETKGDIDFSQTKGQKPLKMGLPRWRVGQVSRWRDGATHYLPKRQDWNDGVGSRDAGRGLESQRGCETCTRRKHRRSRVTMAGARNVGGSHE
jgi:hypothetical protein